MESPLDLDNFFETDIIKFLDERVADKQGIHKQNFYQKAEAALKKNDVETVLNIFEDLTNRYNSIGMDNAYKTIIYGDILELVEMAKKNAQKLDNKSELARIVKSISENEDINQGDMPEVITAFQKIKIERAKRKLAEEEVSYKTQAELEKKRQKISKELFVRIRKKELAEAILNYQRLKKNFEEYPSKFKEDKEEFYNDILSFYMQIRRLKEDLQSKDSNAFNEQARRIQELKGLTPQKPNVNPNEIKEIMFQIKTDVDKKDFNSARAKIIDLRHIASKIEDKNVRNILETKINALNQNIDFVKRASEQKA